MEMGVTGTASDVYVKCEGCGASRPMSDAFDTSLVLSQPSILPPCRGRHPHLLNYCDNECDKPAKSILLGASNSWFPLTIPVLSLPPDDAGRLSQLVHDHWVVFDKIETKDNLAFSRRIGLLKDFSDFSDDEIWTEIEKKRDQQDQGDGSENTDLKNA